MVAIYACRFRGVKRPPAAAGLRPGCWRRPGPAIFSNHERPVPRRGAQEPGCRAAFRGGDPRHRRRGPDRPHRQERLRQVDLPEAARRAARAGRRHGLPRPRPRRRHPGAARTVRTGDDGRRFPLRRRRTAHPPGRGVPRLPAGDAGGAGGGGAVRRAGPPDGARGRPRAGARLPLHLPGARARGHDRPDGHPLRGAWPARPRSPAAWSAGRASSPSTSRPTTSTWTRSSGWRTG